MKEPLCFVFALNSLEVSQNRYSINEKLGIAETSIFFTIYDTRLLKARKKQKAGIYCHVELPHE